MTVKVLLDKAKFLKKSKERKSGAVLAHKIKA